MQVVVAGIGRLGTSIAERLCREDCEVTVIDSSDAVVTQCTSRLDVRGIVGSASNPETLRRARMDNANILVATTDSDSTNIVACQLAHTLFEVPTKIARVRNDSYHKREYSLLFGDQDIPVDVVLSPEKLVSGVAAHHFTYPSANTAFRMCGQKVSLFGFTVTETCELLDIPLSQLTRYYSDMKTLIAAVQREGELIVARDDTMLRAGDTIYALVATECASNLMALFGFREQLPSRILLAGGGRVGRYVARHVFGQLGNLQWLTIIDRNPQHAHLLASEFDKALILHGNVLDRDVLREAGAGDAEIMLSLTNDNRDNMLTGVMAKEMGCQHAVALLHGGGFERLVPKIGLDGYIDPLAITNSEILRYLRRGSIQQVQTIADGMAEVVEVKVSGTMPLVNREIASIEELKNMRVGLIVRGGEVIIPSGTSRIVDGDLVTIMCPSKHTKSLQRLLRITP